MPPGQLSTNYPPTFARAALGGVDLSNQLPGGGPLGGQIGIPTYFMPEDDYSPMWHIGFAWWAFDVDGNATMEDRTVVKGIEELKQLRREGKVHIQEWPAAKPSHFVPFGETDANGNPSSKNNYNFEHLMSPHVVNCPTPITIDMAIFRARNLIRSGGLDDGQANNND